MRRAAAVFGSKDFVRLRLTGTVATDETEAAVAPGSAHARGRSADMFGLLCLNTAAHLLPPARPSASLAGHVTATAAAETGLPPGIPVAIGAGDVPANVIGGAALAPGTRITILGTTCLNGVLLDAPSFTPPDLGLLFTVPGGLWLRSMVNVSGTTALDWCISALCPDLAGDGVFGRLEALAASVEPGASGLTFLPYLSRAGIIAPQVEASARGGFSGLITDHGRAHLVRAIYEGVMFAVASCYDAIGQSREPIRIVGGGGRSRFWCQMLADITESPVLVPEGTEFGARGAALLAATAIGHFASVHEAVAAAPLAIYRHDPDPTMAKPYAAARQRYDHASWAFIETIARRG
jgi:sugar (pentulose or hexulose) kinase